MKKVFKIIGTALAAMAVLLLMFGIMYFFTTRGEYTIAETVEQNPEIPHIQLGDRIFHAETFGNDTNPTVIVLHGGPGNDFRYLLPLKPLSEKYFLVFYDQRGTGLSPRVSADEHTLENSLKDLDDIINYYARGEQVNLIGHSWGAMLASGYIARHPEKVNKAVLAEPGMLTTEKAREFTEKFEIKMNWNTLQEMLTAVFESIHLDDVDNQSKVDYVFGRITSLDIESNPMLQYFCDQSLENAHIPFWRFSAVAAQHIPKNAHNEEGQIEIDLVSGLENFDRKVLFIVGECNELLGEAYQRDHMQYFPNAEMVVIKDAGHTMLGEKPQESMRIIKAYFEE